MRMRTAIDLSNITAVFSKGVGIARDMLNLRFAASFSNFRLNVSDSVELLIITLLFVYNKIFACYAN